MTDDEIIEVVSAHKAGKRIQVRIYKGDWRDTGKPSWNFGDSDYRIAPEPFECWAVVFRGVDPPAVHVFETKYDADTYREKRLLTGRTIKLREVEEGK